MKGLRTALGMWAFGCFLVPVAASADDPAPAALVDEVRRSFTLEGKPIPPEILRDFGDGEMADSADIWVTVDVKAATGSNLYYDEIAKRGDWIIQTKPAVGTGDAEQTSYTYIGAAENGLLVVLAAYSGGGTGVFMYLHVLDIASDPAFDLDGEVYQRIDLTNLRTVVLGDRWDGEVSVAKNTITVVTTRKGPADDSGARETTTIEARRP